MPELHLFAHRLGVRGSVRLGVSLLAGLVLTATMAGTPANAQKIKLDRSLREHPMLQYGAQATPDAQIDLIVTKANKNANAQQIAKDVGATVKKEFRSSGTFSTRLSFKDVEKLAKHKDVKYVSPDIKLRVNSIDPSALLTSYEGTIGTASVWNDPLLGATGRGVTVAVLDSGVASHIDLPNVQTIDVNAATVGVGDGNGHGTHVVGTINGRSPDGHYVGVAPDARVISIKVSDANGQATSSEVMSALQWVTDNAAAHNIRALNLSISAGTAESYTTSPLDAAVEQLWFAGVTVVAAAGNRGSNADATWYAPGNDPYVITVGAVDDNQTVFGFDDSLATFSSRGLTQDGIYKPDVVAPGRKIAAPAAPGSTLVTTYPERLTPDGTHLLLSGTSMATPVVTGTVALLLERFPSLAPDQIKWLLTTTARSYTGMPDQARMVEPAQIMSTASMGLLGRANVGLVPNTRIDPTTNTVVDATAFWDTAFWDTAFWDTAFWDTTAGSTF